MNKHRTEINKLDRSVTFDTVGKEITDEIEKLVLGSSMAQTCQRFENTVKQITNKNSCFVESEVQIEEQKSCVLTDKFNSFKINHFHKTKVVLMLM